MATKRAKSAASEKAMAADDGIVTPRLSLTEHGFTGLRTSNGRILQEQQQAFRYPHLIPIINEMRNNPTVGAAWNVYNFWISRKEWCVEADEDASEVTKERAEIVESMMHDMEDSWSKFIQSVIPYKEYGFSIHETVPYRRLKRNGSSYNDGLIGIKKLAIRNQDTIERWNFSEDGRELLGVSQNISTLENSHKFQNLTNKDGLIDIPREKFLLFTAGATAGNPQGKSMYANIYLAYKQLKLLQDQQLLTIAKEAKGLFKVEVPAAYLSGENAPDGGASAEVFKELINNYNNGTVSGMLLPQQIDQESKLNMFNYGLLENKGTASIDVEAVIKRLQKDILVALSVDVLALGTDGSGSFALAESKTSILALAIDAILKEIKEVLNRQLMTYIYKMNGWDTAEMCYFTYEDNTDTDMEAFGSFVQKIFSTGAIEVDRPVMNKIRSMLGVEELPEDMPVDRDKLPANMSNMASRSGDGMAVGTSGNGTAKINGDSKKTDPSTANVANK